MGKVIDLQKTPPTPPDDLITSSPWQFRQSPWEAPHFFQIPKAHTVDLESCPAATDSIESHFLLKGGMVHTIRALYTYREREEKMREIYYLAGLMDCMINQISPILRTDILRSMYKKIIQIKENFRINWYGPLDQVLLPVHPRFYDNSQYRSSLNLAGTMKELYQAIRKGTDEMFDILSVEYVFYHPKMGGLKWRPMI
jgi:hypothetical protein